MLVISFTKVMHLCCIRLNHITLSSCCSVHKVTVIILLVKICDSVTAKSLNKCVLCVWTSPFPHSQIALIIRLYLSWTELTGAAFSGSLTLLMKHHKSKKTHVSPCHLLLTNLWKKFYFFRIFLILYISIKNTIGDA